MGFDLGNLASNLLGSVAKNVPGVELINDLTGGFVDKTINKSIGTLSDQLSGGKNKDKTGDGFEKAGADAAGEIIADLASGKKVDAGKIATNIATNAAKDKIAEKYGEEKAQIAADLIDTAQSGKVNAADVGKKIIDNSNLNDGQKVLANTVVDILKATHDASKENKKVTAAEIDKDGNATLQQSDGPDSKEKANVSKDKTNTKSQENINLDSKQVTAAKINDDGTATMYHADGTTTTEKATVTANENKDDVVILDKQQTPPPAEFNEADMDYWVNGVESGTAEFNPHSPDSAISKLPREAQDKILDETTRRANEKYENKVETGQIEDRPMTPVVQQTENQAVEETPVSVSSDVSPAGNEKVEVAPEPELTAEEQQLAEDVASGKQRVFIQRNEDGTYSTPDKFKDMDYDTRSKIINAAAEIEARNKEAQKAEGKQ